LCGLRSGQALSALPAVPYNVLIHSPDNDAYQPVFEYACRMIRIYFVSVFVFLTPAFLFRVSVCPAHAAGYWTFITAGSLPFISSTAIWVLSLRASSPMQYTFFILCLL
jgi:hypothetical protein